MQRYGFSPAFIVDWVASGVRGRSRDFGVDARREFARYREHARYIGLEQLPAAGPFIVATNHYQRRGMGAEWTAIAVSAAVAECSAGTAVRWMHQDGQNGYVLFDRYPIPPAVATRFLGWASRRYGFLPVAPAEVASRAPMLRHAYALLHRDAQVIGIMPEGDNATPTGELAPAKPGAGPALAWLCAGRVPVVPVGVYDDADGTLVVRFGPAFTPPRARGEAEARELTAAVMQRVVSLLPSRLHGAYAELGS